MKKSLIVLLSLFIVGFWVSGAFALSAGDLSEWTINYTNATYHPFDSTFGDTFVSAGVTSALDSTNLGTITWSTSAVGSDFFVAGFNYDIGYSLVPTDGNSNDTGDVQGTPAAGESYQLGDPLASTVYDNIKHNTLTNTNDLVPDSFGGEDVYFALGWNFTLTAGQKATVTLHLTEDPTGLPSFYLWNQSNTETLPDGSLETIYYWGDLNISGGTGVPEPGTLLLTLCGLAGLIVLGRKRVLS